MKCIATYVLRQETKSTVITADTFACSSGFDFEKKKKAAKTQINDAQHPPNIITVQQHINIVLTKCHYVS